MLYLFWEFLVCFILLSNYVDLFIVTPNRERSRFGVKKYVCLKCLIERAYYLNKYDYDRFLLCHIFFNFARIRFIKVKIFLVT